MAQLLNLPRHTLEHVLGFITAEELIRCSLSISRTTATLVVNVAVSRNHAYCALQCLWHMPLSVQSGGYVGRDLEITLRVSLGVRQVSDLTTKVASCED